MTTRPAPLRSRASSTSIDPRSPRFGAGITAVLLLVVIALSLAAPSTGTLAQRVATPGLILFVAISALFAWGAGALRRANPASAPPA